MAPTFTGENITIGRVKWFNNKSGYGFITSSLNNEEKDVFVHHSSIMVDTNQYKYLVAGEYVSFIVEPVDNNEKYNCQAKNIKGVGRGPLMCETRNEMSKNNSDTKREINGQVNIGKNWMLVKRKSNSNPKKTTS
jgi:cold shock CspA family protein